ncbi:kinase-like domain-containing protein [Globomyces pollinis-pini]|nr:kinase-like domain-containing protein [Globomyces pollinis-pini]
MDCLAACFGNKTNNNHTLSDYDKHYFTGTDLGAGAFAVVKKATRKSDGKQFAVKIIDKAKVKGVADVQTEIEVLKKLHHSHIISLIDLFQTNTHYYLIMELATGGELFDRILAKGKYTEKDAASLVKQLLKALNYLHDEVNIVHRDLKPENLIFRDPSETSDLLVTDFGLSKVIQSNEFLKTSSGTPSYVAPEILQESGHGKGVDMWSTGVITYVMLCGYTPFWGGESNSTTILYQSIVKGKYEYEEEYWGMISSEGNTTSLRV